MPDDRPFVVSVLGTGTEVGKTWATCALIRELAAKGITVSARKPVQSYAPDTPSQLWDSHQLSKASGEDADEICIPERSIPLALAPPIAARFTGSPGFSIGQLADEIQWRPGTLIGFVETAGGCLSPIADDGNSLDLALAVCSQAMVLVADAGLGSINAVLSSLLAIDDGLSRRPDAGTPRPSLFVLMNRYDGGSLVHRSSLEFLLEKLENTDVGIYGDHVALAGSVAASWESRRVNP